MSKPCQFSGSCPALSLPAAKSKDQASGTRRFLGQHGNQLLAVLACAILWLGGWYTTVAEYREADQLSRETTGNLARAFEQYITRTVQSVDQLLIYLGSSYAREPGNFDLKSWAKRHHLFADLAFQIALIDRDGRLLDSTLDTAQRGLDLSDRPHFRAHADFELDGLYISDPVLGRVSQKWSIQFTRRLTTLDGAFAGVAVISVDPSYFSRFYDAINLGKGGAIVLLGADGVVRARAASGTADMLGATYVGNPLYQRMLEARDGSLVAPSPEDAVIRVYSFRRLDAYPLSVAVGVSYDEAFAGYQAHRTKAFLVVIALSALLLGLAWMIRRHQNQLADAQRQIQARALHYRTVVDGINEVIFQVDRAERLTFLNAAWTRLTGYSVSEASGQKLSAFINSSDQSQFRLIGDGARRLKSFREIVSLTTKDGQARWFEMYVHPDMVDGGAIDSLHGTLTDVTEWYVAERTKRESDLRWRVVFDTAVDGIITVNEDGIIEQANSAMTRIFQVPNVELIGKHITALAPAKHAERNGLAFRQVTRGAAIKPGQFWEVVCQRGDGSKFPIEFTMSEMHLPSGRRFTCVIRDITERKKIDRMKDELVSTVSHELRTPMTAIVGALGLVRSGAVGEVPPKALNLIEMAHRNCNRLVRLLNDILDLGRIGSGEIQIRMAKIDLARAVSDSVALQRAQAEQKKVALDLRLPESAPVRADSDRIAQVVNNLVSNALKYSPPGGTIRILVEQDGSTYRTIVEDQGPGIPESFKADIFKRFARADSSDSRVKEGTGLGLAICKLIVERHGGTIGFESTEGQGATFFFDLPGAAEPAFESAAA